MYCHHASSLAFVWLTVHAFTLYHLSPTLVNHKHTHNHVISLAICAPTLHHTTQSCNIIGHLCTHLSSHNTIGQCLLYNMPHTAVSLVLYAVDKGLRGQNVLQSLLLILLRICSRSVRPIQVLCSQTVIVATSFSCI